MISIKKIYILVLSSIDLYRALLTKKILKVSRHELIPKPIDFKEVVYNTGDFGILIQGPYVKRWKFTLRSIIWLRNKFPDACIVYSFINEYIPDADMVEFERYGINILRIEDPLYPGLGNVNRQIKTVKKGLEYLEGCTYIWKIRSDQRFYSMTNLFLYFKKLSYIDISKNSGLSGRILISSLGCFRGRLYPVSDFMMFGRRNDLLMVWDIPYDSKKSNDVGAEDFLHFMRQSTAEGYILNEFGKKINWNFKWNLQDSQAFMKSYFCIIDKASIGHLWYKYYWYSNYSNYSISEDPQFLEFSYSDWITWDCNQPEN